MKTKPEKRELEELRTRCTREELAHRYKVSISTIRRWVQGYGLQRKRKESPRPIIIKTELNSGVTLVEKAKRVLGLRLVETRLGYRLDGRPVNTDDILKAAKLSK